MGTSREKLAQSLEQLHKLQERGQGVFRSQELTRVHRDRLIQQGFLRRVMKGWLISTSPGTAPGDTTPWYASFWEFCARYCSERFGDEWHLSPEQSLLLHAENTLLPEQVIIYTTRGTNNKLDLLFGTSLYDLQQPQMPPDADLTVRDGLPIYTSAAALARIPGAFFQRRPLEARVALSGIRDASALLAPLLEKGRSVVAGRLAGAFRRNGQTEIADEILRTMKAAGHDVRETDPFAPGQAFRIVDTTTAPIVGRVQAMWQSFRSPIAELFPAPPGLPTDTEDYLRFIDEIYASDAYHSLSIEGYVVTPELINKVRLGDWDADNLEADRSSRDALAARGYWEAFQLVKETVERVVGGGKPGPLVRSAHRDWYRALFLPCVRVGLVEASALAGYRNDIVFLRGSRHVPPRWQVVRDAMPALFDLLEHEPEASVRAVLGHWLLGYIHPYPDGNGRIARFVMNAMLASGGYPWTIIRVDDRARYMASLESASAHMDIRPFAAFVAERVRWSLARSA